MSVSPIMPVSPVPMTTYVVNTSKKRSQAPLSNKDLIQVGYLAGRCGVNLDGDPNRINTPKIGQHNLLVDINDCTTEYFEQNLNQIGLKFDRMA
jgi:hypothetical protein